MKNIVICADLNEFCLDSLRSISSKHDLKNANVHIIHVFEIHMYTADIVPIIYPAESQYPEIEDSAKGILSRLAQDIGVNPENAKISCFFSSSREDKISEYLNESKADLVIVATRGKHGIEGFFSSSLEDYLCKYSPCDVLVIRPKI